MRILTCLIAVALLMTACSSEYGNKVSINKHSDVFYKGKGVTEDDARRLGNFLLREGYFDTTSNKTVQLTKDSTWVVKLVVDKAKYDPSDATIRLSLKILEMVMQDQVFNKERTRLVLADDSMEEIKMTSDTTAGFTDDPGKTKDTDTSASK